MTVTHALYLLKQLNLSAVHLSLSLLLETLIEFMTLTSERFVWHFIILEAAYFAILLKKPIHLFSKIQLFSGADVLFKQLNLSAVHLSLSLLLETLIEFMTLTSERFCVAFHFPNGPRHILSKVSSGCFER